MINYIITDSTTKKVLYKGSVKEEDIDDAFQIQKTEYGHLQTNLKFLD